jgi:hypothetical protein
LKFDLRPIRLKTPPIRFRTPPIRFETPPIRFKTPPIRFKTPPIRFRTPRIRFKTPPIRFKTPPIQFTTSAIAFVVCLSEILMDHWNRAASPTHEFQRTFERPYSLSALCSYRIPSKTNFAIPDILGLKSNLQAYVVLNRIY